MSGRDHAQGSSNHIPSLSKTFAVVIYQPYTRKCNFRNVLFFAAGYFRTRPEQQVLSSQIILMNSSTLHNFNCDLVV